jgi:hypothetical protein
MSPEQAKGKAVDKRADIWAFGCVLYEMLTGRRTFDGEDVTDALAAVVRSEPDLTKLPTSTPAGVTRLVRWCLEKDPRRRLRDIADARSALETSLEAAAPPSAHDRRWWHSPVSVMGALLLVATVAGFVVWNVGAPQSAEPRPVRRASINLPASAPYMVQGTAALPGLALSPDGSRLVYAAAVEADPRRRRLHVLALDRSELQALAGTDHARQPFFSPDGESVAFFTDGGNGLGNAELQKISLRGGPPQKLCNAPFPRGGVWGPDGRIVFASGDSAAGRLFQIPADGGTPAAIDLPGDDAVWPGWPDLLPNGALLFTAGGSSADYRLMAYDPSKGAPTILAAGHFGRYVATGHVIWMLGGTLHAAHLDAERLTLTASPVPVAEGIQTQPGLGAAGLAISRDGTNRAMPLIREARTPWRPQRYNPTHHPRGPRARLTIRSL